MKTYMYPYTVPMLNPSRKPRSRLELARKLWRLTRPASGFLFEDAEFLSAELEVDPRRARAVLPLALWPLATARATLFVAHFPKTSFGSVYNECGLFLHLRGDALHCPWILVDDDVALITGRELLGYPKKLGTIDLSFGPERVKGSVSRRGARIVEIQGELGAAVHPPPPVEGRPTFNVKGGVGLLPQTLVAFRPKEEIVLARRASIELRVSPAEHDPIHELGFGRVLEGWYHRLHLGGRSLPLPLMPLSPAYWLQNWMLRTY